MCLGPPLLQPCRSKACCRVFAVLRVPARPAECVSHNSRGCHLCWQQPSLLPAAAVKDAAYRCVICRGVEAEDAPSANTADHLPAADAADATSPPRAAQRGRQQQQRRLQQTVGDKPVPNNRAEAEAMGIEVPRGLGGAALRSFLRRQWLEEEEEAEEEGGSSAEEPPQQQRRQRQQQDGQQQAVPQQRSQQQPSQRQMVGRKQVPNNRAEAEAMGIEVPPGLGGAALRSFLRRQWLEEEEAAGSSDDEQPQAGALPSNRAEAEAMGMELPPGLGGAALRSYLLRQQREREEEAGDSDSSDAEQGEQPGSQRAPRQAAAPARRRQQLGGGSGSEEEQEEQPRKQRKVGSTALAGHVKRLDHRRQQRPAPEPQPSSSSSEDEEEEEEWPYAFPPPPRKLGGAALRSYIKRQEQLLEEQQQGSQLSGSSSGTALGAGSEGESDGTTSGRARLPQCRVLSLYATCRTALNPHARAALHLMTHQTVLPQWNPAPLAPATQAWPQPPAATRSGGSTRRTAPRPPSALARALAAPRPRASRAALPLRPAGTPPAAAGGCRSPAGGRRHGTPRPGRRARRPLVPSVFLLFLRPVSTAPHAPHPLTLSPQPVLAPDSPWVGRPRRGG